MGDGNCFFHAIQHQLESRAPHILWDLETQLGVEEHRVTHAHLRRLAIGGVIGLASCNDDLIQTYSGRLQHDIHEGSKDGTWANDLLIEVLCQVLQITIVLINSDNNVDPSIYSYGNQATLYLGYEVQRHFQSTTGEVSEALRLRVALVMSQAAPIAPDRQIALDDAYQMGSDVETDCSGKVLLVM